MYPFSFVTTIGQFPLAEILYLHQLVSLRFSWVMVTQQFFSSWHRQATVETFS